METVKRNNETERYMEQTENSQQEKGKTAPAKKRGDAQIVVAMVMIVIALVLCFLFKNQITTFMTTAISTMSTKMSTLLNGLD